MADPPHAVSNEWIPEDAERLLAGPVALRKRPRSSAAKRGRSSPAAPTAWSSRRSP